MHFTPGLETEDCGIIWVWFASCVTLGDSLAVLGGLWEVGRALHSPGGLEAEQVQGMGLLRDTVSPASVSISQPLAASAVWRRSVSCLSALTLTQTKTCSADSPREASGPWQSLGMDQGSPKPARGCLPTRSGAPSILGDTPRRLLDCWQQSVLSRPGASAGQVYREN